MIVDLVRNDLGRVSEVGSVRVAALREPREQVGVQHLVSRIEGRRRDGAGDAELIAATFPPGSVTGAPKVQALKVIGELEAVGRGVFCGAIGYRSPVAGLELSVGIRTLEARGDVVRLQVGGGIVSDSGPGAELAEVERKARPVLRALGADVPPAPRHSRPEAPRALAHACRPDPNRGSSRRCAQRKACRSPGRSTRRGWRPRRASSTDSRWTPARRSRPLPRAPPAWAGCASSWSSGAGWSRPGRRRRRPACRRWRPTSCRALAPYVLPGGLGPHKWRDRSLLDALSALGGTPLLLDADGEVLEAAWAAVVLVEGDRMVAAPDDDRRLASITVRGLAGVAREPFDLPRLQAADAVMLAASVSLLVRPSAPA